MTNFGPYHDKFEKSLAEYLEVPYVSLVSNATLGLSLALQALEVKGKVITTPYTFVATAHAIVLSGNQPVFVDIDPLTCNLDACSVEKHISDDVVAIMPVHVYGNACDTRIYAEISDKYNIPVLYDAAHAFGIKYNGMPLVAYGEYSVLSFHATKVFNTVEGGAVVSRTREGKNRIDLLRNFGIINETEVRAVGTNSKMNELLAAYGIMQLKNYNSVAKKRARVSKWYDEMLSSCRNIEYQTWVSDNRNYSYYPIFVENEVRERIYEDLKNMGVFSRRYFYPVVTEYEAYADYREITATLKAERLSRRVLCLPISDRMKYKDVNAIAKVIRRII